MNQVLLKDIKNLPGVGSKRAGMLNKELEIYTYQDLLYYFPFKYVDKSKFFSISDLQSNLSYIQLKGKIISFRAEGFRHKKRLVARFTDGTGTIELVWFKGHQWILDSYKLGEEYIIFGKPSVFNNRFTIAHPEIESPVRQEQDLTGNIQPAYNTTEKLKNSYVTSRTIQKLQFTLLKQVRDEIQESLPGYFLEEYGLLPLKEALYHIHFPGNYDLLKKAIFRLKFEELFTIQLGLLRLMKNRAQKYKGFIFERVGEFLNTFYRDNLPFELTGAQKRVLKVIRKDLGSGIQMNRLLQGDVGSGKTLVALMSMLIALDNQFQACLMAPTEILASQHYKTIKKFITGINISCALLTGSTKKTERVKLHNALMSGDLNFLIGTHALIEDVVQFKNLGLVVIDEQHRFGVAQRAKLWKKNIHPPHVLVMTATPIPRTLAMTIYGDLDVSVIDELPPGRRPVLTKHYYDSSRLKMFGFVRREIKKGRQVYFVYPMIKESETMDYKYLEDGYESIVRAFSPPDYAVSIMHGKMKGEDKDSEMQNFKSGRTHIMVSTTVIEVGVDVPNASVIVIESAERFGLSQLHQLRGRVGRGGEQSYCLLMTSYKLSEDARKRIEIMVNSTDGFEIAEADLKLRGPGDLEGTQQSGIAFDLKLSNLAKDGQILQYARDAAAKLLDDDPFLEKKENCILKEQLETKMKSHNNWSDIS